MYSATAIYNLAMQPIGPSPLQLLRQVPRILTSPVEYLQDATREYGDLVHFQAGSVNAFLINHPDAVQTVLRDHHQLYNKDTIQYNALAKVTGRGLLTNSGASWLKQRRLIQPAFARQKLAKIEPFVVSATGSLLERWRTSYSLNELVDVDREMMHLSLEVLGLALFGADLKERVGSLVEATLTALNYIMAGARNPLQAPAFLPTARNRRFKSALHTLDQAIRDLLQEREQQGLGDDLLSLLIFAQKEQGKEALPDSQIRDEIITLLIAGHETVATALSWSWYLLAKNPDKRSLMFAEVDSILDGETPQLNQLQQLPYTGQVFLEALRIYPPAWLITRKAMRTDQVGGIDIPAESLIIISPFTMHRNQQYWQDVDSFSPERFNPEQDVDRHKFAYIPFGGGPALCIGKNFALIEAQMILAMISQEYTLELDSGQEVGMDPLVTLRPAGGLHMRLVRRKTAFNA